MIIEVVIGLDPHKASNTIAVLDRHEALLTRRRFGHNDEGLVAMFGAVAGRPKRVCAPDYRRSMTRVAAIFGGVSGYVRQWPFAV